MTKLLATGRTLPLGFGVQGSEFRGSGSKGLIGILQVSGRVWGLSLVAEFISPKKCTLSVL